MYLSKISYHIISYSDSDSYSDSECHVQSMTQQMQIFK